MVFNSIGFIAFLVLVLALYNLVHARFRAAVLLTASYLFYTVSVPLHGLVLLTVTVTAFGGARLIEAHRHKGLLAAAVGLTVLPLVAFKYSHLFASLVHDAGVLDSVAIPDLSVPAGLSFYTLIAVSYVADVYLGPETAEPGFSRFALYVAWFPTVLSGPIERGRNMLPQLRQLVASEWSHVYVGVKYVLWGLFCKVVVADNLASVTDEVLRVPQLLSGETLWLTFGLFSFQIYFDLAGYTSIAIGVSRMFNIRLSRNFNCPYLATSLQDFWWRWHITLSQWFRDYVYLSLGGNRRKSYVRATQLLVVFLVSGLWHGAAWHYVAWGGLHGSAYVLEERIRRKVAKKSLLSPRRVPWLWRTATIGVTFAVVTVFWVFFRLESLPDISMALERMFYLNTEVPFTLLHEVLEQASVTWAVALLCSAVVFDVARSVRGSIESVPETPVGILKDLMIVNWLVITLVLLGDSGGRDFMYARF